MNVLAFVYNLNYENFGTASEFIIDVLMLVRVIKINLVAQISLIITFTILAND